MLLFVTRIYKASPPTYPGPFGNFAGNNHGHDSLLSRFPLVNLYVILVLIF